MQVLQRIEYIREVPSVVTSEKRPPLPFFLRAMQLGFWITGQLFPRLAARLAFKLFSTPRIRAQHKASDEVMETARIFEFMYMGRLLKAYEWGRGDKVVLLVHGWESRGTALRSFVPDLLAQGYRVVAFDGPAHGNSGGKRTDLGHFGGAIRAIINHLGGVYGIVAHSFGGSSTVFALSKLDTSIALQRLVLIASPADMQKIVTDFFELVHLPMRARHHFLQRVERRIGFPPAATNFAHSHPDLNVSEVLVIHDEEDPVVPISSSHAILQHWDNARLLISRGLGHYRLMKHAAVIKRVVSFMN
ncbi:MAG: alpha/beta hydrolase [Bacteroidota bacterium]